MTETGMTTAHEHMNLVGVPANTKDYQLLFVQESMKETAATLERE